MGIIQQQALKGTAFLYAGVLVGFASTIALTHSLSTSQNGLVSLLISYSDVLAQTVTLGFPTAIGRVFSYFRDKQKQHNGFFFLIILSIILGTAASVILYYGFKPLIIDSAKENSEMFISYVNYLLPLVIFRFIFMILDRYYAMLYNAVIGIVLKEFIQRILIIVVIFLHFWEVISFNIFVILYVIAFCIPSVIIIISLALKGEVYFKPQLQFLTPQLKKAILNTSFYGLLIGFNTIAILRVDVIMIGDLLGLSYTGIYTIAFYFATLVKIPSRALTKITATIFADSWRNNELKTIRTVYQKSSLHQFVIALLLFIGIWANVDNIFEILPKEYIAGKYVIFFIGLSALVDMIAGGGNLLISTSKHYKKLALFMFILLLLLIVSNAVFIPIWGITGAAFASFISTSIYFLICYLFIVNKFKMNILNKKHFQVLLIGVVSYIPSYFLPKLDFFVFDIIVRSSIISLVFGVLIYYFNVSEEINNKIEMLSKLIKK